MLFLEKSILNGDKFVTFGGIKKFQGWSEGLLGVCMEVSEVLEVQKLGLFYAWFQGLILLKHNPVAHVFTGQGSNQGTYQASNSWHHNGADSEAEGEATGPTSQPLNGRQGK